MREREKLQGVAKSPREGNRIFVRIFRFSHAQVPEPKEDITAQQDEPVEEAGVCRMFFVQIRAVGF